MEASVMSVSAEGQVGLGEKIGRWSRAGDRTWHGLRRNRRTAPRSVRLNVGNYKQRTQQFTRFFGKWLSWCHGRSRQRTTRTREKAAWQAQKQGQRRGQCACPPTDNQRPYRQQSPARWSAQ